MVSTYSIRIRQVFGGAFFVAAVCWGVMAAVYSNFPAGARFAAAGAFVIAALCSVIFPRGGGRKAVLFLGVFLAGLGCWLLLPPSNSRDWRPDVAVLPSAGISGDTVTIRNVRDCNYRSETDYDVRHHDLVLDLGSLRTLDLFLVDWGLPHLAHTMLSFGFGGGKYVCVSIETRKKKGEEYSSLRGFFKQYELTYVVAEERDLVRLRTNYRKGEEVYLYRLKAEPEFIRLVFLDYLRSLNRLKDKPQWYNALTANCTTDTWKHVAPHYPKIKYDWRVLASGHIPEMAYELGVVDRTLPLAELKIRSHINARSQAAAPGPHYSQTIRQGLPGFQ